MPTPGQKMAGSIPASLPTQLDISMSHAQLVASAFQNDDSHRRLGTAMAEFLYETMNRPGFFRTFIELSNLHTVSEFTSREWIALRRIQRRHPRVSKASIRFYIQNQRKNHG